MMMIKKIFSVCGRLDEKQIVLDLHQDKEDMSYSLNQADFPAVFLSYFNSDICSQWSRTIDYL